MSSQPEPSISAVTTFLPDIVIETWPDAENFGFSEAFLRDKVGFLQLRKSTSNQRTFDLALGALSELQRSKGFDWSSVECLVVCTQNPDGGGLPNTASTLHGELGLSTSCAAFDISLGCSGYVYGLAVIKSFMMMNGMARGILVTADPYSKIVRSEDRDTALLFGDGAAATLLEIDSPWKIGRFILGSDGSRRDAIAVQSDGFLKMNGRQVFSFAAETVPTAITAALQKNGLVIDEIDLFLLHQGSRYIVDELGRRLNITPDKIPFKASGTGNLVSSSIPFLLQPVMDTASGPIVLAGFGVGLSWGVTCLIPTKTALLHQ